MTDRKHILHEALVTRILEGDSEAINIDRRAALDNANVSVPLKNLVEKAACDVQPLPMRTLSR
jgi:hypothetical protein